MKETLLRTLEELETALEKDQYREIPELTEEVFEAYDRVSPNERIRIERAKEAAKRIQNEKVDQYLNQVVTANLNRTGLSLGLGVGLPNPDETGELLDLVVSMRNREMTVADAGQAVDSILENISIPSHPAIGGVIPTQASQPLGESVPITITVVNVGDEPLDEVKVAFAGNEEFYPDSRTATVTDVKPRGIRDVIISVVPIQPGQLDATVSITGQPIREERRIEVEVFGKSEYFDRVAGQLKTLAKRVRKAGFRQGNERSLLKKVEAAIDGIEHAEQALADGNHERADNQLRASSRKLGAFINELDEGTSNDERKGGGGQSNVEVSSRNIASLLVIAKETIGTITDAIQAETA